MRKIKNRTAWLTFILVSFILCQCAAPTVNDGTSPGNTTYYVDPAGGNDENSGLKAKSVWRTFSNINSMQFAAGDRIEIISPGAFDQSLILSGEGTPGKPVTLHFSKGQYDFYILYVLTGCKNCNEKSKQPNIIHETIRKCLNTDGLEKLGVKESDFEVMAKEHCEMCV